MIFTFGPLPQALMPSVPTWWSLLGRIGMQYWAASNRFYEIDGESIMPRCRLWRNDRIGFGLNKVHKGLDE